MLFNYVATSVFVGLVHDFNCSYFCPRALYPDVKVLKKSKLHSQI